MPLTIVTHKSKPQSGSPPGGTDDGCRFLGAGRVGFGVVGRRRDGQCGRVDPEVTPADGLFQCAADDVVNFPDGAATERSALVTRPSPAVAEVTAALQPRVEAFEQLGVQLARGRSPSAGRRYR